MVTIIKDKKPVRIGNSWGFRVSKSEFKLNPGNFYKIGIVEKQVITDDVPDSIPELEEE